MPIVDAQYYKDISVSTQKVVRFSNYCMRAINVCVKLRHKINNDFDKQLIF